MSIEQISGEATGIYPNYKGDKALYDTQTEQKITDEEAKALLEAGKSIACVDAGAGSYQEIARRLGLGRTVAHDTSSSAGDWVLGLPESGWMLHQSNRHPFHGFIYSLSSCPGCSVDARRVMKDRGWIHAEEAVTIMSPVRALAAEVAQELWAELENELVGSALYVNVLTWDVMSAASWDELMEKTEQ